MGLRARKVALLGVATSGLLVAASCGSSGGGTAATTAAPATTAAAATTAAPATTAAAPATTAAAPATTAAAPGTTAAAAVKQTIKVGVAWEDLAAFVAVNPAFGDGDPAEQAQAVLDAMHKDGRLPVNGVDVQFVTKGYSAIKDTDKTDVCQSFGADTKVFAALGGRDFSAGAQCLASKFHIPVIDANQAPKAAYAAAGKDYFTLKPDETTIATTFAKWALKQNYLQGKKVGLYWETPSKAAVDAFKQQLATAGVSIASEVQTTGQGVGADQDALAAQKFKAAGADLVIFFVGSSSIINFLSAAGKQSYTPKYVDFDWASHLSDVAAGAYDQTEWANTPALASIRAGDLSAGLSDQATKCLDDYDAFSGKQTERTTPEKSGEFSNILITCDLANLLLEGIKNATANGAELTQDSLVSGLESVTDFHGAYWDTIGYSATDHEGAKTGRPIAWDTGCKCYKPTGDWAPLASF
jgi:hypothetical protein